MFAKKKKAPDAQLVHAWLADHAQPGDLLLIGACDPVSRFIQRVTQSPFSHASVVVAPDEIIEAYDYNLTASEEDEGVYKISFADFAAREKALSLIAIYRVPPGTLDMDILQLTANLMHQSAPTYPTVAAVMFVFGLNCGRVTSSKARTSVLAPSKFRIDRQARFFGDGPRRVHCAEMATRLYCASGADIEFHKPFLSPYMDRIVGSEGYRARDLPSPHGTGDPTSQAPESRVSQLGVLGATVLPFAELLKAANAVANRMLHRAKPDIADYVMPSDFTEAKPFQHAVSLIIDNQGVLKTHTPKTDETTGFPRGS